MHWIFGSNAITAVLIGKGDHNITKDMADKAQRRVNAITAARNYTALLSIFIY